MSQMKNVNLYRWLCYQYLCHNDYSETYLGDLSMEHCI